MEVLEVVILVALLVTIFFIGMTCIHASSIIELELDNEVDCFDYYSNKIEDTTCKEVINCGLIPFLNDKKCRRIGR